MRLVPIAFIIFLLAGCATTPQPSMEPGESSQPAIAAEEIDSMDDGIAWAAGLDDSVTAMELSVGLGKLGEYFVAEDVWFQTNNEIGGDIIHLNGEVLSDPDNAATKVDDVQALAADIEAAIEKGNVP